MDPNSAVDPVAAVVAALQGRNGTRWIGVDGKGATGKTTLAARIAAALPGSVVVHIDDFARPDVQGWERDRFVRQVLKPLLAGRPGGYPQPTNGSVFRGTSPSGSRCRTWNGWREPWSGTVQSG